MALFLVIDMFQLETNINFQEVNKMRKLFLVLAALFLVQSMAYAEEGKEKGKRFEENKEKITNLILLHGHMASSLDFE